MESISSSFESLELLVLNPIFLKHSAYPMASTSFESLKYIIGVFVCMYLYNFTIFGDQLGLCLALILSSPVCANIYLWVLKLNNRASPPVTPRFRMEALVLALYA